MNARFPLSPVIGPKAVRAFLGLVFTALHHPVVWFIGVRDRSHPFLGLADHTEVVRNTRDEKCLKQKKTKKQTKKKNQTNSLPVKAKALFIGCWE